MTCTRGPDRGVHDLWKSFDLQVQLRLFLTSATCSKLLTAFSRML
jgi:hypothetical protein